MRSLSYYCKAVELTDAMLKAGLLKVEEGVYHYSCEIPAQNLAVAREAVEVYRGLQLTIGFATKAVQVFCVLAVALAVFY